MITCSQCQTPLSPGTRFCPNCGLQFENPVPESAAAFQVSAPAPAKKKSNPLVLGLLGLVGFFVLVGIVGGNRGSNSSAPSNDAAPAAQAPIPEKPKSQVTMANYNRHVSKWQTHAESPIWAEIIERNLSNVVLDFKYCDWRLGAE